MRLSFRARKRLALLMLVLGLPAYIFVAVTVINLFERPPVWVEFCIYAGLGVIWVVPLRRLFLGVGRADPEEKPPEG